MAMDDSLRDLELIMDANLDSAFLPPADERAQQQQEHQQQESTQVSPLAEQGGSSVVAPPPMFASMASLSLALGSLMSSNFVLSKAGMLPRAGAAKLGGAARCSGTAAAAAPSQKRSHAPNPVTPSAKVKLAMTTAPQEGSGGAARSSGAARRLSSSATAFPDLQMLRSSDRSYAGPGGGAGLKKASIVWFRNDLRVHDNEALAAANQESLSVIPVYCFDPRDYGKSSSGFDKTGPYRAKFLLECVNNLRDNLRQRGSDLVVRVGKPEEVLGSIAKAVGAEGMYAHQEVSAEEMLLEDKVSAELKEQGVDVKYFWGSTLFHVDDLPFKLEDMPANYGGFRERVKDVSVRPAAAACKQLKGLPSQGDIKPGPVPTLQELGLNPNTSATVQERHSGKGNALVGGEEEALKRLQKFSMEAPAHASKGKAGGAIDSSIYGTNFSCKISPWLALGCLSPRKMLEDLKKNTSRLVSPAPSGEPGLQWLVCELLWRDFFRFVTKKYGAVKKNQTAGAPCLTPAFSAAA